MTVTPAPTKPEPPGHISTGTVVHIYTDGACSGNPGPGGWGVLIKYGRQEKEMSGGENHTTNNRMELTAAIKALQSLTRPCHVILHTDSKYMVDGITDWIHGWLRRGWKNSMGKPVENRDLWEELYAATKPHKIEWKWVKGHAGHSENERVDVLAFNESQKIRKSL